MTEGLPIPETADEPEPVGHDQRRSGRLLVALAAAVVVVLVAAVTVALTRGSERGSRGARLTIEALAATTQKQSARVNATQTLSPVDPTTRPTSNCSPLTVGCTIYYKQEPVIVTTSGIIDFRSGNGRVDMATRQGSKGRLERLGTTLVVDGQVYESIGPSLVDVPANIRRTKRWVASKAPTDKAGLNPFDPLAVFTALHITLDDHGMTRLGDQPVRHYHGVKRTPFTPPSTDGPTVIVTSTIDVYADGQNRLVRLYAVDQEPQFGASTLQVDFSDYGINVNITAPPADQVYTPPSVPPRTSTPATTHAVTTDVTRSPAD